MPVPIETEQAIFDAARKMPAGPARDSFVAQVCADDASLISRIQALLAAYVESERFLQSPPPGLGDALKNDLQVLEHEGAEIGPYKLLEIVGEGGMGIVYRAEQKQPVERIVALKIIKPGLDTRQVIARFEAERQALALMDHPHIAKVLDAGTTDHGRPFFVMELVKGIPITIYCDQQHLNVRQRLDLMIPVCQAIQHAHQKGIIHRDIKPSNVLVTQYDGHPDPKVIDFGVAKAVQTRGVTEQLTEHTHLGQIIGTLEYMSPEQAELNPRDIDTRSDIYSLGVLLYELLTGVTPFDKQRFRDAAFHEMLRIIREEEPERPSFRLSRVGSAHQNFHGEGVSPAQPRNRHAVQRPTPTAHADTSSDGGHSPPHTCVASIAAVRSIEPTHLSQLLRGELDWIVMKALEKDRSRRYETASSLALDLQCYLADEPVQACPPSTAYMLGKLIRRRKSIITTASLVLLSLLAGTFFSTWQAVRATRAERLAKESETRARSEQAKAIAAALIEADLRKAAQEQTQIVEKQRQQLQDIDRINSFVVNEILKVIDGSPDKRHQALLTAISNLVNQNVNSRVAAFHTAGNLFVTLKDYTAAHAAYGEGLKLQPRHGGIFISRGDVFFRQKKFEEAIVDYTAAIGCLQPTDAAAQYIPRTRRGLSYCHLGQFEDAEADIKRSYDEDPERTLNLLKLSFRGTGITVTPYFEGIRPTVIELADRYVLGQQQSIQAKMAMADFFGEFKQFGESGRYLRSIESVNDYSGGVYYRLAYLALVQGDVKEHRRVCQASLEACGQRKSWNSNDWALIIHICTIAPQALDDYTPLIQLARQTVDAQPANVYHRYLLGAALYRAGEPEEANVWFQKSREGFVGSNGENAFRPFFLAMIECQEGKVEQARNALKSAIANGEAQPYHNWRYLLSINTLRRESTKLIGSATEIPTSPASTPTGP